MLHGKAIPGVDDKPGLFMTNKAKFKDWGVTHVLSFNEPDVSQRQDRSTPSNQRTHTLSHARSNLWAREAVL